MNNFTVVRRGYSTEEVDSYISQLEAALALKNQQLKEYQAKENAITNSIVSAEVFADALRRQAEEDAADIRATALNEAEQTRLQAQADADELNNSTRLNLASLRDQALAMHGKLEEFQGEFGRILQDYLVSLRTNDLANIFSGTEAFINALSLPEKAAEAPLPEDTEYAGDAEAELEFDSVGFESAEPDEPEQFVFDTPAEEPVEFTVAEPEEDSFELM